MNTTQSEALALAALGWLAFDRERISGFLDFAGADPGDLAGRAADPEFLGFVLDYLLQSDEMVRDFCSAERVPLTTPMRARAALPGGDTPNWT